MQKAIISDRIYLKIEDREVAKKIVDKLTYKFGKKIPGGKSPRQVVETLTTFKRLPKGIYSLPQGRLDLIPEGYDLDDRRVMHPVPFPEPKLELYPDQLEVYEQVEDSCFINALPGWGKTFTALHVAKKLGQKTLIITNTVALRDQWVQEINILFGVAPGIIGSGTFDIEDHYIVVGNIQTLTKHTKTLAKEFGTVIVDEAHHCPASTFVSFLDELHARYRIGLSGTRLRKDGKHVIFNDYFGHKIFTPNVSNTLPPKIARVNTGKMLKPGVTWVEKINELLTDHDYIRFVAATALSMMGKGHQVLIIADRVEFLKQVTEYVGEDCLFVAGEVGFEEREIAKNQLLSREKMCVAGSRQIFSEGISINTLSCVILATPTNNDAGLEQIIGRVMRKSDDKKLEPLVIDLQFLGPDARKQNEARLALYLRKGWQIISI